MKRALVAIAALLTCAAAFAQDSPRTIHVFVALADNQHQGIIPVPKRLGNGEDPANNLYWGSAYGVKSFFARSTDWKLLPGAQRPKPEVLERCIFKHRTEDVYLVADAYRGGAIRQAVVDFLEAAAGEHSEKVSASGASVNTRGGANLVAYIGHDGLMDFQLSSLPTKKNDATREAIILACASKSFFAAPVRATGAYPLLWTTGLMAPEAYTLQAALDGWIGRESHDQIHERAAVAYDKYQHCGLRGARKLFASGW